MDLYTGNDEKINTCQATLNSPNAIIVIEGARGVGTTSFGNFLRFNAQSQRKYFTPTSEIRVEPNWQADTLLAAVIANVVSTLELQHYDCVTNLTAFKQAKATVQQVTETYRSFGASAFGFGGNVGTASNTSQPMLMPTHILSQHLEKLVEISKKLGFNLKSSVEIVARPT